MTAGNDTASKVFIVNSSYHGKGAITYSWNPSGKLVATTGPSKVVHIADTTGAITAQVVPPSPSVIEVDFSLCILYLCTLILTNVRHIFRL